VPPVFAAILMAMMAAVAGLGMAVAAVTARSAAVSPDAGTKGPPLTLLSQSPFVTPGGHLDLRLSLGAPAPAGALEVSVTLYDKVHDRSTFEQTEADGPQAARLLDPTQVVPVAAQAQEVDLSLPVSGAAPGSGTATGPALDLGCPPDTGLCPGVYPLEIALGHSGGGTIARMTTFLTYAEAAAATPLRFALVVPLGTPVGIRSTSDPARALRALSPSSVATLTDLVGQLEAHAPAAPGGGVPVTVEADPRSLQALDAAGPAGHRAVQGLSALSTVPGGDEFPAQPYVPIDPGALAGAGLTGEVELQMVAGADSLRSVGLRTSATTWVSTGPVGSNLAAGLRLAGAGRVVVPDTQVTSDPGRGSITQPFGLALGRGSAVDAAASDSGLAAHFAAHPQDPVLAANQLLADLAFIYSEAPNAAEPRGVVAVPPAGWHPRPAFMDALLTGLTANPSVDSVTLQQFFAQVPRGGYPNEPTVRHPLTSGPGPTMGAGLARRESSARLRYIAFRSAVPGNPAVLGQLSDVLLASQSDELRPAAQSAGTSTFERDLAAQLSQVQLATDRTITLTARTAPIPVTVLSSAHYEMVGTLTLVSDKFEFPQGATKPDFVIRPNTNSVRIEVQARTSGDLPLQVSLIAPHWVPGSPPLVITHGQLTVRSTATSIVGITLTLAAAAILLAWWVRTWRRGRAARRATGR
jgi:hypothetical protein